MTVTLHQISEWLVLNGIQKIDTEATDLSQFTHRTVEEAYWFVADAPDHGLRLLNTTPAEGSLPLRCGITFFASPANGVVESLDIGGAATGSFAGLNDATALTTDDLPRLMQLLHPLSKALAAALADDRPLTQHDLVQAIGPDQQLLALVEVDP